MPSFIVGGGVNLNVLSSNLTSAGVRLLVSSTAYFVYLGYTQGDLTPLHVEFYATTLGAGAQTAEVGFFSTPSAPNKAGQSLTKLVSSGTLTSLTSTGLKRNTTPFATLIPGGTFLWAGIRTAMATTQPTLRALADDWAQGRVLTLAGAGVLTGAGPFAGAIVAATDLLPAPDLRGSML